VQNLLAYCVGCLTINVLVLLVPLMVLNFTPTLRSFVEEFAGPARVGNSTIRPAQIGMGVLALLVAALMTVRSRARQRANLSTPARNTSTPVLDSNTPTAMSRPLGRAQDAATNGGSAIRRLLDRAYNSWENGSLWVTFWMGILYSPAQVSIALAIIAATGAAIVAQLTAAIAFIVAMLAVVEIILVSCLITPAKTQAVLGRLHDWVQAHIRQVLIAIPAILGVSQVITGMGLV
jgi:Sap, sulfolipid-1-addressing protein